MALALKNNAVSRLASSLAVGDTVLQITATEGSRFPLLEAGDWFPVTVLRATGALEIMRCTARAGDALTVTRAQEGTSALTFDAGDRVELRLTAGAFNSFSADIQQQLDDAIDAFIPPYTGNAGKALVVKPGENAAEWSDKLRAANFIDKTVTNAASTGAVALDLSAGDVFALTLTGATTLSISNPPTLTSETLAIVVRVAQGGTAYALTWFSGVTWLTANGTAPDAPAANKTIEYVFTTADGVNWLGRKGGAN